MTYTDIGLQIASNVVLGTVASPLSVASHIVGSVLDLNEYNNAATRIGDDNTLWFRMFCRTQMITAGTLGSITFHLVSDAKASLNNLGSGAPVLDECTPHLSSIAISTDDEAAILAGIAVPTASYLPNQAYGPTVAGFDNLTQTAIIEARLPRHVYERYLGVIAVVGTAAVVGGAVDAHFVHDIRNQFHYPNAI